MWLRSTEFSPLAEIRPVLEHAAAADAVVLPQLSSSASPAVARNLVFPPSHAPIPIQHKGHVTVLGEAKETRSTNTFVNLKLTYECP